MAKYGERDVVVLHVYVSEPHAGERGFRDYTQPGTYDERALYAQELVTLKGISGPVLVDGMDDATRAALGGLPNVVYVVGKDGRVHYKSSWADADKVDRALAELVTGDDPDRPVEPSFETQDVGPEI
ncbi:MAG: hypothetical protein DK306_001944 [Chloroflexi bacterium]|jgi:hypothetical protein|nr:MAG: hypothetical protein DK306_001944 [Chloroflexota bacterium]